MEFIVVWNYLPDRREKKQMNYSPSRRKKKQLSATL